MRLLSFLRGLFGAKQPAPVSPPARKSEAVRITCQGWDDLPTIPELEKLAIVGQYVVLMFPPEFKGSEQRVIDLLAPLLPDHSVYESGGSNPRVTIFKVIDEQVIRANLPLFLTAIADFAAIADDLCRRLALAKGVAPEDLLRASETQHGQLPGWNWYFHGGECCFTSTRTGQIVDAYIDYGGEFGVLDPYFLSKFIRSSPAHVEAARLLSDNYHDASRVMDVLLRLGCLIPIEVFSTLRGFNRRGLVLAPAHREFPPPA
jgi:hypothetical protein